MCTTLERFVSRRFSFGAVGMASEDIIPVIGPDASSSNREIGKERISGEAPHQSDDALTSRGCRGKVGLQTGMLEVPLLPAWSAEAKSGRGMLLTLFVR